MAAEPPFYNSIEPYLENRMNPYPRLLPGDIGATRGKGIGLWACQHLITPATDRFHFFIIGDYLSWDDDYVILESIGKGISVGRLSFYHPEDLEIYRVNLVQPRDEIQIRKRAAAELTRVGRASYDWILIAEITLGALTLLLRGKLPPWEPGQFPYGRDRRFVCTEAANEAWRGVSKPIIPAGVAPLPAGFKQALNAGKLQKIFPEGD